MISTFRRSRSTAAVCSGVALCATVPVVLTNQPRGSPQAKYYEALCKEIDPIKKELVACFPMDAGLDEACFKLKFDILVLGVSSSRGGNGKDMQVRYAG